MNGQEHSEWMEDWGKQIYRNIVEELYSLESFQTENKFVSRLVEERILQLREDKEHYESMHDIVCIRCDGKISPKEKVLINDDNETAHDNCIGIDDLNENWIGY